jgi:hypothetical protein
MATWPSSTARSDSTMSLNPSPIASIASDAIRSNDASKPSRPDPVGNVISMVLAFQPRWSMCFSNESSSLDRTGCGIRRR